MRRIACIAVIAAGTLVSAGTSRLAAQAMASGTWGGTLVPPGDEAADLQFQVVSAEDAISITMVIPGFGELPLDDVTLEDGTLRFSFNIGLVVKCSLAQGDDGGFAGTCNGEDGNSGQLTMTPPKKG